MSRRVLRWWSQKTLAEASARLDPAWRRWCAGWAVEPGSVLANNASEMAMAPARMEATPSDWRCISGGSIGSWLSAEGRSLAEAVAALLFARSEASPETAGTKPGSIGADVVAAAQADLQAELAAALSGDEVAHGSVAQDAGAGAETYKDTPPSADMRPWSGAIAVSLAAGTMAAPPLRLHLGPAAAERWLGSAATMGASRRASLPPLGSASQAAASLSVTLSVELNDFSLDVGTLQSLRTGDVLTLAHSLDAPLWLRPSARRRNFAPSAPPLCQVLLGARRDRRAVELVGADAV